MNNPEAQKLLQEILNRSKKAGVLDESFLKRLSANFQVIFANFHSLYPMRGDMWDHLETVVHVLIDKHLERSGELKERDHKREQNPQWILSQKHVGMMLYVDRFAGDLKGLQKRLPYLEELGVNLLHLMPILKCPEKNNDGGYAVSDYTEINQKIGTMEEVQQLATTFRNKDMVLMMDLVLNHTSDQHEWAQKARSGDQKYQNYYYFFNDRTVPDQFEQSLPQVFPESSPGNFTYIEEVNKWVMTVFHNYQWDLNYANPEVFIEMLNIILFLSNQGIDILRLDALAFMWKKIGTTSQNLDEAHILIKTFKSCLKIAAPGTLFLAEAIVSPPEIIKYFGEVSTTSNECDLAYNATLMTLLWDAVATKNNRLLQTTLHNIPARPTGASWLNYVRCHDDIGLGYEDQHADWAGYSSWPHRQFLINFLTGNIEWSFARGRKFMEDKVKGDARISGSLASLAGLESAVVEGDADARAMAIQRIIMLHSIIMSYGGIPMIYAGDELARLNDYSFENDPALSYDNRWMHRPVMDWKHAEMRKKKASAEGQVFGGLKKLIGIRKKQRALADYETNHLVDCHNQHLLSYVRGSDQERILVVCNLNDQPEALRMDIMFDLGFDMKKGIKDLYLNQKLDFSGYQYILKPHQFVWIIQS